MFNAASNPHDSHLAFEPEQIWKNSKKKIKFLKFIYTQFDSRTRSCGLGCGYSASSQTITSAQETVHLERNAL